MNLVLDGTAGWDSFFFRRMNSVVGFIKLSYVGLFWLIIANSIVLSFSRWKVEYQIRDSSSGQSCLSAFIIDAMPTDLCLIKDKKKKYMDRLTILCLYGGLTEIS